LSEMPASKEAGAAVHALLHSSANFRDRWIPRAATSAAARHDSGFLAAALADKRADAFTSLVRIVAGDYARGESPAGVSGLLGRLKTADPAVAETFLGGLAAGWGEKKAPALDKSAEEELIALMKRLDSEGQLQLATLGARWGLGAKFKAA